ncbi:MAG: enoyl-CoA hydratase/isomerase family protein [Hyphomicrobiaceae bacterium]|nr:enoyl-CoA hydratase/isomerase family protein [Hyphomicrobiaceae bacterium]
MTGPVLWSLDARGVARVTLNRPEVNNAYDGAMIEALHAAMNALAGDARLRVVVVAGSGRHFQAGADLDWLSAVRAGSPEENEHASRRTAEAVDRLNRLAVPSVALVQGFCVGGGTGLVAACDIAIAAEDAKFAISEARWGLTAAIIVPQLADAIGARQIRRYALTCERFGAEEARRIGLVHEVVPAAELEAAGERIVGALLANGPKAMAETKALALEHALGKIDGGVMAGLVVSHARKRQSEEAAEGLASFAEKRPARW